MGIYSTKIQCVQERSKLSTMLDESTLDCDYFSVFQKDIDEEGSFIKDETDINNIINVITNSTKTITTLTKTEFKQIKTEEKI